MNEACGRTGTAKMDGQGGITSGLGREFPERHRLTVEGWGDLRGIPWDLRRTERLVGAQPGALRSQNTKRDRGESREVPQENREHPSSAPRRHPQEQRTRKFYVVKKDV